MGSVSNFMQLEVWQKANFLYGHICTLVDALPYHRKKSLGDQIERAAISVTSNIVEGHARYSPKEFLVFLGYARGSLDEVRAQLQLLIQAQPEMRQQVIEADKIATDVSKMLHKLIKAMQEKAKISSKVKK